VATIKDERKQLVDEKVAAKINYDKQKAKKKVVRTERNQLQE
jgi:hypothetical protein